MNSGQRSSREPSAKVNKKLRVMKTVTWDRLFLSLYTSRKLNTVTVIIIVILNLNDTSINTKKKFKHLVEWCIF